jgi:hypothetical protein
VAAHYADADVIHGVPQSPRCVGGKSHAPGATLDRSPAIPVPEVMGSEQRMQTRFTNLWGRPPIPWDAYEINWLRATVDGNSHGRAGL